MGDVAMIVPVVQSLSQQYPNLQITVLSQPFARFFFEGMAGNVKFMPADIKKEYKDFYGLNKLYHLLAKENFSAISDFHGTLRAKYITLRFKLRLFKTASINKHRKEKKQLICKKGEYFHQLPTSFESYAEVLKKLGYPIDINFRSIYKEGKGNFSTISDRIEEKKVEEKWIGIAPFAAHKGKIYPIEKLKKIVDSLLEKNSKSKLFFFGAGNKEKDIINFIANNNTRCISVSDALKNLGEELILMSHLDVMLSMDSSNMHLASLVGTRVVSVWGATHPYAGFLGWNQSMNDVVQKDIPCRPCSIYGNKECRFGNYQCMDINPEEILKLILD